MFGGSRHRGRQSQVMARPVAPAPPQSSRTTGTRLRPRVLIADDHDDTREMYAWCMRAAGWIVAEATDGLEALTVAAAFAPHAIVMDLHLPNVHGLDAIRKLRADDACKGIPIIACTGIPRRDMEIEALAAGCDAFVRKPFSPEEMCDLLEEIALPRCRTA
jgi:two-component system cell cycle response regulator DivK